ncbi:hypothetical protein ACFX15_020801 [Malus domestica]|uniref:Uncharacterized protein n=1 Tax=Malus domestica TaxID=3750 RepID=A0A498HL43_MALDO|nr:hypothetical protein DVH24_033744 [Malus domestica]
MASKCLNLVLLDRNTSKLEASSNEIREKYGGKLALRIFMDLAKFGVAYRFGKFIHDVDDWELMEIQVRSRRRWEQLSILVLPLMPSFPLYLSKLSRSISLKYKQHGIDIQCQIPSSHHQIYTA